MVSLLVIPVLLVMKTTQEHATNAVLELIQLLVVLVKVVLAENGRLLEPLLAPVNHFYLKTINLF